MQKKKRARPATRTSVVLGVAVLAILASARFVHSATTCNSNDEGILLTDCPIEEIVLHDGDAMNLSFGSIELSLPYLVESTVGDSRIISHEGSFTMNGKGYGANGGARSVPGPVIRMDKGAKVTVQFMNDLDPPSPGNHTSNIHTHGLHVSGAEDDVAIKVKPGEMHLYNYTLPTDHAGGTHWYHPHMHPLAVSFTGAGAAGMIIIEDADDGSEIPIELMNTPEQIIFIQHMDPPRLLDLSDGVENDPFSHRINLKDTTFSVNLSSVGYDDPEEGFADYKSDGFFLINGLYKPRLELEQGVWYRWRMAHVAAVRDLKMAIYNQSESEPAQCQVRVISRDGVYLKGGPRDLNFAANHSIHLHPANRCDVLIRCTGSIGTKALVYDNFDAFDEDGLVDESRVDPVYQREFLMTLNVVAASQTSELPDEFTYVPCLPFYLADLLERSPNQFSGFTQAQVEELSTTLARPDFLERWEAPENRSWTIFINPWSINNEEFAKDWITADEANAAGNPGQRNASIMLLGEVQEWDLTATSLNHPLHIHVNHYQLLDDISDETGFHKRGDWVDTIRPRGDMAIRFRFEPDTFLGRIALHCHNLEHSDEGAKAQAYIIQNPNLTDARVPSLTRPWADICGTEVLLSVPTQAPTRIPTKIPTRSPTKVPTTMPPSTSTPSNGTTSLTPEPTTLAPTFNPTTEAPTQRPTSSPTTATPTTGSVSTVKVAITNVNEVTYSHEGIILSTKVKQARSDLPLHYCWVRTAGHFTDDLEEEVGALVNRSSCTFSAAEKLILAKVYATSSTSPNLAIKPYTVPASSSGKVNFRYELTVAQENMTSSKSEIGFRVYGFPDAPTMTVSRSQGTAGVTRFNFTAVLADATDSEDNYEYKFALERNTIDAEPVSIAEWSSSSVLANIVLPFTQETDQVSYTSIVAYARDQYGAESKASTPTYIRLSVPETLDDVDVETEVDTEDPAGSLRNQLAFTSVVTRALVSVSDSETRALKNSIASAMEEILALLHEREFSTQLGELIMLVLNELALSLDDDDASLAARVAEMFQTSLLLWRNYIVREAEEASESNIEPNIAFIVPEGAMGIAAEILAELTELSQLCSSNFSVAELHSNIVETVFAPRLADQGTFSVSLTSLQSTSKKVYSNEVAGRFQPADDSTFIDISSDLFDPGPSPIYDEIVTAVFRAPPSGVCSDNLKVVARDLDDLTRMRRRLDSKFVESFDYDSADDSVVVSQNVVTDVISLELIHSSVVFAASEQSVNVTLEILYPDGYNSSDASGIACGMWNSTINAWSSSNCRLINITSDITIDGASMTCECVGISDRSQFAGFFVSRYTTSVGYDGKLIAKIIAGTLGSWLAITFVLYRADVKDSARVQKGAVLAFLAMRHFKKEKESLKFMQRDAFEKLRTYKAKPRSATKSFIELLRDVLRAHSIVGIIYYNSELSRISRSFGIPMGLLAAFASVYVSYLITETNTLQMSVAGFTVGAITVTFVMLLYRLSLYSLSQNERHVLRRVPHLQAQAIAITNSPWHHYQKPESKKAKKPARRNPNEVAWRNPRQVQRQQQEQNDQANIDLENNAVQRTANPELEQLCKRQMQVFIKRGQLKYFKSMHDHVKHSKYFRLFQGIMNSVWFFRVLNDGLYRIYGGKANVSYSLMRNERALSRMEERYHIRAKWYNPARLLFFVVVLALLVGCSYVIALGTKMISSPGIWTLNGMISFGLGAALEFITLFFIAFALFPRHKRKKIPLVASRRGTHFSWDSRVSTRSLELENMGGQNFAQPLPQSESQRNVLATATATARRAPQAAEHDFDQKSGASRPAVPKPRRHRGSAYSASTSKSGLTGFFTRFKRDTVTTADYGTEYDDEYEDYEDGYETAGTDLTFQQPRSIAAARTNNANAYRSDSTLQRSDSGMQRSIASSGPRNRRPSTFSGTLFTRRRQTRSVFTNTEEDEDDPNFRPEDIDFV